MFIVIVLEFLKIFNLDDLLSSENNTRGGDKDKEEKEFMVFPYKIELYFVATTVIPVANAESVFLKLSLVIFFHILFCIRITVYPFIIFKSNCFLNSPVFLNPNFLM